MFFGMLVELADGIESLVAKLDYEKQIRCFYPICCCHVKPGRIFLHRCKQMILQFVVIKPILAVLIWLLSFFGYYNDGDFSVDGSYLYITIVYNISFTIALYFLILFYESIKHILAKHKPLSKFLCIKAVVFFSYWQSIIIAIMTHFNWVPSTDGYSVSDVATGTQNFLICVEMFPLALAHISAFGYKSYTDATSQDVHEVDSSTPLQRWLQVANIPDVWKDTYDAMKRGPQRHVQVGNFMELSNEDKLKHVVKQGWLHKRGEDLAKLWKLRFCVLIDDPKGLVYFKRNIFEDTSGKHAKPRGFVEFAELVGVAPHRKKLQSFVISTAPRKWHFKASDVKERDEWMEAIEKLHGSIIIGQGYDEDDEVDHQTVELQEV